MKKPVRRNKYNKTNTNYYEIAGEESAFARKNLICRILAIFAAVSEIAAIIVYAVNPLLVTVVIKPFYEATMIYVGLYFLAAFALVWTAVYSFFGYTLRREVPERRSPVLGFRITTYLGILLAAFLTFALAAYHGVLMIVGDIGALPDITVCLLLSAAAIAAVAHFVISFTTNRNCVLVITEESDKAKKENTTAKPLFRLTEEEIEEGKTEFAPPEEKPKKKKRVAYKRKDGSIDYGNDNNEGNNENNNENEQNKQ